MAYQSKKFKLNQFLICLYYIIILLSDYALTQVTRDVFDGELIDIEFRVAINPGKRDCFYQLAKKDHSLEISFQVINSKLNWMYPLNDNSDLRINFELFDPYNRLIIRKENSRSETHIHQTQTDGVYAICFDNSQSRIASKIINLELYLYSDQDDDRWGNMDSNIKFEEESKIYADSVETLKASVNKIRDNLQKVSHNQDAKRAVETRDHNIMNSLSRFINFFSVISIVMILLVGFCQVKLVRSLFDNSQIKSLLFRPMPFFNFFN